MKLWIFSDLHLEYDRDYKLPKIPDADLCICVGDIFDRGPARSLQWLSETIAHQMPVLFVPGNHEYYHSSIKEGLAEAQDLAAALDNVTLLNIQFVVLNGIRFIGTTLWTDFMLQNDRVTAMKHAARSMNDYEHILNSKAPFSRFTPEDSYRLHQEAMRFIADTYSEQEPLPTVVLTHHAPSALSVAPQFQDHPITPAFVSALDHRIISMDPLLWVHGHTHSPFDYKLGRARVICNPRGYGREASFKSFNPTLVIDLNEIIGERYKL
jgi:Icc-related predicted phosphoesterase